MAKPDYVSKMDWLFKGKTSINSILSYSQVPINERISTVLHHLVSYTNSDTEKELITNLILRAEKSVDIDPAEALFRAFQIGCIAGKNLNIFEISQQLEDQKKAALHRKALPREARSFAYKLLKGLICDEANKHWKGDKEKKIRVGQMTDIVYTNLAEIRELNIQMISNTFPCGSEKYISVIKNTKPPSKRKIREWVGSVAPSYAKKHGRARTLDKQ